MVVSINDPPGRSQGGHRGGMGRSSSRAEGNLPRSWFAVGVNGEGGRAETREGLRDKELGSGAAAANRVCERTDWMWM